MDGVLLIDKPEGWTSFDVVNYVRRIVARIEGKKPRQVKVGHTGTLDPAATGLLVLCVGKATKRVPELIKQNKTYQVEVTLGKTSTTGDKEGNKTVVGGKRPAISEIKATLKKFIGEIMQIPPIYSAIKVDGKRAYQLARAGKPLKLEARKVTIHSIDNISYHYPYLKFRASVGSGTYIRSLAEDIGSALGCGAYMSNLRRSVIGDYDVVRAYAVSELNEDIIQKALDSTE